LSTANYAPTFLFVRNAKTVTTLILRNRNVYNALFKKIANLVMADADLVMDQQYNTAKNAAIKSI
jgi:hypothetical protein